jgi:hypothetical protein
VSKSAFYIQKRDNVLGPFTQSQLIQLAKQGKISAESNVRKGSSGKWHIAGTIRGLRSFLNSDAPHRETQKDVEAPHGRTPIDTGTADDSPPYEASHTATPERSAWQSWNSEDVADDSECEDAEYEDDAYDESECEDAEYDESDYEYERRSSRSGRPSKTAPTQLNNQTEAVLVINRNSLFLIGGFLGLGLQLLACVLPWVQMGVLSIRGIKGDGKIAFAVTSLAIIGVVAGMKWQSKTRVFERVASGWGTIAFFWMLALMISLESRFAVSDGQNVFENLLNASVSPGSGLYLGLFSGLLTAGCFSLHAFNDSQKEQTTSNAKATLIRDQGGAITIGCLVLACYYSGFELPTVGFDDTPEHVDSEVSAIVSLTEQRIDELDRKTEWYNQYNDVLKEETHAAQIKGLKRIGFIVRFDKEARNVTVDHFGWKVLSDTEHGRYITTSMISKEMRGIYSNDLAAGEVTLFSSVTGQSLAWVDTDGEVHILR